MAMQGVPFVPRDTTIYNYSKTTNYNIGSYGGYGGCGWMSPSMQGAWFGLGAFNMLGQFGLGIANMSLQSKYANQQQQLGLQQQQETNDMASLKTLYPNGTFTKIGGKYVGIVDGKRYEGTSPEDLDSKIANGKGTVDGASQKATDQADEIAALKEQSKDLQNKLDLQDKIIEDPTLKGKITYDPATNKFKVGDKEFDNLDEAIAEAKKNAGTNPPEKVQSLTDKINALNIPGITATAENNQVKVTGLTTLFERGKAEVNTAKAKQTIEAFKGIITDTDITKLIESIEIKGFASTIGTNPNPSLDGKPLSLRRSEAMKEYLKTNGANTDLAEKINATDGGISEGDDYDNHQKVEITITLKDS